MKTFFLSAAFALLVMVTPVQAQSFNADQKAEIEALIKEYILNNPEVMIESFENHRTAQEEKMAEQAAVAAKSLVSNLDKSDIPSVGGKDADVTVVEFMDYNCGYCKKAYEEVQAILDEDKKVRFYLVDMPILGPTSLEAAKWALAAQKQGKYFEYHAALMAHQGPKNDSILEDKAEDLDLDIKQMKKDKESPEIMAQLEENMKFAENLSITGTPGFIVGEEVVRGYMTLDQLKELIAQARSGE